MKAPKGFKTKALLDLPAARLAPALSRIRPPEETCITKVSVRPGWRKRRALISWATVAVVFSFYSSALLIRGGSGWSIVIASALVALACGAQEYRHYPTLPVLLEIFPVGLWFPKVKVFVPFECLRSVEIHNKHKKEKSPYRRRMLFTAEGPSERHHGKIITWRLILPADEPFIDDTYENILYKIHERAEIHAGGAEKMPSTFTIYPKGY